MKLPYQPDLLKFPIGPFQNAPFTEDLRIASIEKIRKLPFRLQEITTEIKKEQYLWCYRPEGWSIQEVIHHLADSHMHAFLRLKWTLLEENPVIKGYHESTWTQTADTTATSVISSIQLLDGLHERWAILLTSLSASDWEKGYYHPEQERVVSLSEYVQTYAWHGEHHYRHILLALDHEGKYKKT